MTATSALILVLDNDQALQERCLRFARKAQARSNPEHKNCFSEVREGIWDSKQSTEFHAEDSIEGFVKSQLELVDVSLPSTHRDLRNGVRSLAAQILGCFPDYVDWRLVARHYLDKAAEIDSHTPQP